MTGIRGVVTNGEIHLAAPSDWPEGMEVVIEPARLEIGCREEDQGSDPASIARWLAWYDSLQPLILTSEDESHWVEAQRVQREFEFSTWHEENEKARKLFE